MKLVKYYVVIMLSVITGKTAVNFFGSTYAVAGNIVKRIK